MNAYNLKSFEIVRHVDCVKTVFSCQFVLQDDGGNEVKSAHVYMRADSLRMMIRNMTREYKGIRDFHNDLNYLLLAYPEDVRIIELCAIRHSYVQHDIHYPFYSIVPMLENWLDTNQEYFDYYA